MKRILTVGILVIGVLGIAGAVILGSALRGRQAITDGFEINGIRMVQDGFSSVAVVPIGEGEVALVDGGNDASGAAVLAELSRRGLGPEAVKAVRYLFVAAATLLIVSFHRNQALARKNAGLRGTTGALRERLSRRPQRHPTDRNG